ncbi:flagellar basal body rod protein [Mesobacillus zeae]|uniref:Flagellar basal body rod protein n=1 Tax=Mesobacillus zeae TaxID=1917180 RepID=A0A398B0L3_9BACI|nr:flagellar basal body rod protein [Mesobacillus zeae]RID82448.1 flagellar basal body rod protein [Mesobacillus zeae]
MKKIGLLAAGGIAAIVLISNLGSLIGLAISLILLYLVLKQFLKADSTFKKIAWGVLGFIILLSAAGNIPALVGLVGAAVLYLVYKKWNETRSFNIKEDNDPFDSFEKQWAELKKY